MTDPVPNPDPYSTPPASPLLAFSGTIAYIIVSASCAAYSPHILMSVHLHTPTGKVEAMFGLN